MSDEQIFAKIIELADASLKRLDPCKVKWQWGEALYTYALYLLDNELGEDCYLDFSGSSPIMVGLPKNTNI